MYKSVRGVEIDPKGPNKVTIEYVLKLAFIIINNMAEYEALAKGLNLVRGKLNIYSASQLIMGWVSHQFVAKEEKMSKYKKKGTGTARPNEVGRCLGC